MPLAVEESVDGIEHKSAKLLGGDIPI